MGSDLYLTNPDAFKKIVFIGFNLIIFYLAISYTLSSDSNMDKLTVGGFVDEVFAQDTTNVSSSNAGSIDANPNLQALNKTTPILSRTSHNGIYEVQLL